MLPTHVGMDRSRMSSASTASMLPTHVGMDRRSDAPPRQAADAPHARGDGPEGLNPTSVIFDMLPTHVGMDLAAEQEWIDVLHAPHARGDGPLVMLVPDLVN